MAMAFRGLGKPTDQLDISIAPSGGGFGPVAPGMSIPSQMPMPQAVPEKRPGASFAGIAADFLAGMAGQPGPYAAMVQKQRDLQERRRIMEQQRQADRDDYVWKLQQKAQFPDPVSPHYWETNDGSLGMVGPDGKPSILYKDPTPKMDTIQVRDPATGEVKWYRVPQGGGDPGISPAPGGASNRPAIGSVITDPRKAGAGSGQGGFRP